MKHCVVILETFPKFHRPGFWHSDLENVESNLQNSEKKFIQKVILNKALITQLDSETID